MMGEGPCVYFEYKENGIFLSDVERTIALDKSGYSQFFFLISPQKHMLLVLFRNAMARYL